VCAKQTRHAGPASRSGVIATGIDSLLFTPHARHAGPDLYKGLVLERWPSAHGRILRWTYHPKLRRKRGAADGDDHAGDQRR